MKLPAQVTVVEVGPRDGLQNEPFFLETGLKAELINCLIEAGFKRIEATSFVRPEWIPQLRDAEEVLKLVGRPPGVRLSALVPNLKGYQRAVSSGIAEINMVVSASELHNRKNVNRSIEESLRDFARIAGAARGDGILVRGSVAVSFGCPYQGGVDPGKVIGLASALWDMGCCEVVLADTIGCANPVQVYRVVSAVLEKIPGICLAAHFHDTRGMGLANVLAALQAGVAVFDSSIGGLGGCPYAPGAPGNIATEDLVNMLAAMDVETGIDLTRVIKCADRLQRKGEKRLR
ncbi:MAG: hydroxymethylglutaryl-CoA lyase [Peptococcaceae bacterium]|nr:hydroxymethylglutaryl-CoA lyase [Peptococcaceae bacterium]